MAGRGLTLDCAGRVATLWLDAPPGNRTDRAFFAGFARMVRDVLPGLGVDGLVVRGRGRHFSAGADVNELRAVSTPAPDEVAAALSEDSLATLRIETLPYPVVAAIDGACLGSGLELALACGYRIATPAATLGLPEITFGLMPGCGGTVRLPRLVGTGRAVEMILTGRLLSADEALAEGLVDAIVPRPELHASAVRSISRLAAGRAA